MAVRLEFVVASALVLGAGMLGCRTVSSRYVPAGESIGAGPEGQAAAFYEFVPPGSARGAQVQVWCDGSRKDGFEVAFHVRNDGADAIRFLASRADLRYGDAEIAVKPRETGDVSIPAGQSATIRLHFPFPARFGERPPPGFDVTWAIDVGKSVRTNKTVFAVRRAGYVPEPLDSSGDPLDRRYMDESRPPAPVGIRLGPGGTGKDDVAPSGEN